MSDSLRGVVHHALVFRRQQLQGRKQQAPRFLPAWMAFDFRLMYQFFQDKGLKATSADLDRQTKLLGHAPRSFEDFAAETAKIWNA